MRANLNSLCIMALAVIAIHATSMRKKQQQRIEELEGQVISLKMQIAPFITIQSDVDWPNR